MSDLNQPPRPVLKYPTPPRKKSGSLFFLLCALVAVVLFGLVIKSILSLTSFSAAEETAMRVKCASNLRQIGQAILLYANENHGAFPDSFATLLATENINPNIFVCPGSNDTPATGPTTQAIAANLVAGGHLSYIYVGRGWATATVPANAVVVYEPLTNRGSSGMHVLFGDGHVDWLTATKAKNILANAGTGKPPVILPSGP